MKTPKRINVCPSCKREKELMAALELIAAASSQLFSEFEWRQYRVTEHEFCVKCKKEMLVDMV